MRRLAAGACLALVLLQPAHAAETIDARLQQQLAQLATRAEPGVLGVKVLDVESRARASVHADRAYPMMSVIKVPVAATVLAQIDAGRIRLQQEVTIHRRDVVGGAAVPSIGAHFTGEAMRFTVERLLVATVSESDNTAVDALIRLVGGPQAVTEFLRAHGVEGMRVDLGEAGVDRIFEDTEHGHAVPERETAAATRARERRGYQAYLRDPRNRSTPDAAVTLLDTLWSGRLLSAASTQRLLGLMYGQTVPHRLRAGVPAGARLADKCGTSYSLEGHTAAYNDIGILTLPNGRTFIVAAFLTDSRADRPSRDALFADLGRAVSDAAMGR